MSNITQLSDDVSNATLKALFDLPIRDDINWKNVCNLLSLLNVETYETIGKIIFIFPRSQNRAVFSIKSKNHYMKKYQVELLKELISKEGTAYE